MRFAERFLVILALISLGMRLWGLKDAPTMELIALPLLALFYLAGSPILLLKERRGISLPLWLIVVLGVLAGFGIAYCIISLMLYTLSWLPRQDMLENCALILVVLLTIFGLQYRRTKQRILAHYLLRFGLLFGLIIVAFLLPFPAAASTPL
jgi:hypothetical protein